MRKNNHLRKLILAALFLALSFVLPFFTGQIREIGSKLCPLHIPVILCGYVCGGPWGLVVGFIAPLLRSFAVGLPKFFPNAVCMAFELATYGFLAGVMHKILPKKKGYIYLSLLISMIGGRIVWGIVSFVMFGLSGGSFTLAAFIAGAFINAVPGIIAQIVFIPFLVMLYEKKFRKGI